MNEVQESKKGSCLKAFGIGCAVFVAVGVIGSIVAYHAVKGWLNNLVNEYTETAARDLPALTVSQDQIDATIARVAAFVTAITNDEAAAPLILSADDINILIQKHPGWKELAGKAYVSIQDNQLRGDVSFPLDKIGAMFEGRYLNGSAALSVGMTANQLVLFLTSVQVGDKPLPEQIMANLRAKNLAEDANQKPETVELMSKLESIAIQDNTLQIVPRKKL